ncbi:hypothetical protein HDE_09240 [Halotydeus destructor]|nr:hypothetical protein HDE_09240 [Halotydeus destructor]
MSNEAIDCNDINKMAVAMATDDSINCQQADGAHAFPDRVDENTSDTLSLPAAAVTPLTMAVIADDQWQLVPMAKRFGQSMAIFLGIWSIGYFGASFAWILLGVALTTLREHLDYEKRVKMAVKRDIALDERNIISSAVQYLPSWVHFRTESASNGLTG